tara:strand:- start:150 stop:611 length:462 start_codon:yes stop_codon:yes gene_type:complete
MIRINVISEEKSWLKKIKKKNNLFNRVCKHFPKKYRFIKKKAYLSLLLSNNNKIRILNKKFRNKNKHTDILAFPFDQKIGNKKEFYLGDIIISFDYMDKFKKLSNKEFQKKTIKIFIHGFLHLIGHDHMLKKDYIKMMDEEKKIFKSVQKLLN